MERIIIAYEPVWAIGTGKVATPEQAQEMHGFIRRSSAKVHGKDAGDATRFFTVARSNATISQVDEQTDIDGAIVGGAS
jgi:triosephosphate isomerase